MEVFCSSIKKKLRLDAAGRRRPARPPTSGATRKDYEAADKQCLGMHARRRSHIQLALASMVGALAGLIVAWLSFRLSAGLDAPLRFAAVAGGALVGALPAYAARHVSDPQPTLGSCRRCGAGVALTAAVCGACGTPTHARSAMRGTQRAPGAPTVVTAKAVRARPARTPGLGPLPVTGMVVAPGTARGKPTSERKR